MDPSAVHIHRSRLPRAAYALVLVIVGCTPSQSPPTTAEQPAQPAPAVSSTGPEPPAPSPDALPEHVPLPDRADAASSASAGPADAAVINRPEAAADAVRRYFALLESDRDAEADALWGDPEQAATFRREFAALGEFHAQLDPPGPIGAAAGSMYVTVPVRFIAGPSVPNPRPRMGEVTVRRVNDVPGSTEAQRRWHIERIDVAMTPK